MTKQADTLEHRLGTLPEPPLPPALWPRVARARRRQVARQRMARGGAAAAVLALALLPVVLLDPGAPPAAPTVAAVEAPPAPAPGAAAHDQLRTLDRELQAAYRRGDPDAQIAQLWQAREDLLRAGAHPSPVRPIRI